jgi:hypothetical protein
MGKWAILMVSATLFISGCSTQWVKYNSTPEQAARERYECDRDSAQAMIFGALYAWQVYDNCMAAHGWVQVRK